MPQMRILAETNFRDGAENMALDIAIADAVAAGLQPPTLRLYGWNPFCLSLGYGQRVRDADRAALSERGWDLVRRPTGGKAILHGDELTYSLCLPLAHPLASGDVVESYRRISAGLLRGLEELGLSAEAQHQGPSLRPSETGPVCFEMPSHYEIAVGGRKLIGSAQMRRKSLILQHGSIPLCGDVARICDALTFASEAARERQRRRLRQRAITVAEALGFAPTWSDLAAALARGFERAFDLELMPGTASDAELARAAELKKERFRDPAWTNKR